MYEIILNLVKIEYTINVQKRTHNNLYSIWVSLYVNELESLLSTCTTLLSSNVSYTLAFIRRQSNRVVHSLAKASILNASLVFIAC